MRIVPAHKNISDNVVDYSDISAIVDELIPFTDKKNFPGKHPECIAIHHAQVNDHHPLNFFVLSERGMQESMIADRVIVNPEIVGVSEYRLQVKEACMSWPFRELKKVLRHPWVEVKYEVPDKKGRLIPYTKRFVGLAAQVFQHETDHAWGKTIYD